MLTLSILSGFGAILLAWIGQTLRSRFFPSLLNWDGLIALCLISAVASFIQLFLPLSTPVAIAILGVLSCLCFIFDTKNFARFNPVPLLLIASLLGFLSYSNERPYDESLYYIPSMLWWQKSALIPGTALMTSRIGFNSSLFVLATIFGKYGFLLINILLAASVTLPIFVIIKNWKESSYPEYFLVFSFTILLGKALISGRLSSISSDIPLLLLAPWVIYFIWKSLGTIKSDLEYDFYFMIGVFLLTVKLSALWLIFFALIVLIMKKWRPSMRAGFLLGCWMFVTWILRGFFLTGCLAYPVALTCFNQLPWSIQSATAEVEAQSIVAWSRLPGLSMADAFSYSYLEWTKVWFSNFLRSSTGIFFVSVTLGSLIIIFLGVAKKKKNYFKSAYLSTLMISLFCLLLWWFQAPNTRFGDTWIICFAILLLCGAFQKFATKPSKWLFIALACAVIAPNLYKLEFSKKNWVTLPKPFSPDFTKENLHGTAIYFPLPKNSQDRCGIINQPCVIRIPSDVAWVTDSFGNIQQFYRPSLVPKLREK